MLKLKKGDIIGYYSPSSPVTFFAPRRYERAIEFLQQKGFKLLAGNLTGKNQGYRSGNILERASELNTLIENKDIKCIISTIGGNNSNSILPYINYEEIKKNPKIFIGYSDVTAILLAIYAKTGIITYYGPALVSSFGEFPPLVEETFSYFSNILVENIKFPYLLKTPEQFTDEFINWEDQKKCKKMYKNNLITVIPGKISGRLIGGNLNTIYGIWGSEYMPEIKSGDILFIEDSLKTAADIERSFSFLKLNKVFDKISGVILGKHELFNNQNSNKRPYEILLEVLGDKKIPFLAEFDCSHTHPMLTLPIGSQVELDATNKRVTLLSF
ncbi:LD-carboxypeptidase [Cetobacterium somerae]|uniref:S66 family peptidase n=1 Tax=Cetobacterium sp. NK01 TaxID=2993530 RepID=UPI002115E5C5|nr:S66 peptidase family protein [Cetobacterium sp. NK01]MCQ8213536.1 LD-carboxypeptidase [Cetobacterium sp. NK01]